MHIEAEEDGDFTLLYTVNLNGERVRCVALPWRAHALRRILRTALAKRFPSDSSPICSACHKRIRGNA